MARLYQMKKGALQNCILRRALDVPHLAEYTESMSRSWQRRRPAACLKGKAGMKSFNKLEAAGEKMIKAIYFDLFFTLIVPAYEYEKDNNEYHTLNLSMNELEQYAENGIKRNTRCSAEIKIKEYQIGADKQCRLYRL